MKPEQLLPEGVDSVEVHGITVRKGSVGAFLASWRILCDTTQPAQERAQAEADLLALIPVLAPLGLFIVFEARDPRLRDLITAAMPPEQPMR